MDIFVTGIGTGVGKTIVSALLSEMLGYGYWKPIQCGDLERTDSLQVAKLTGKSVKIHQEAYRLAAPQSPHYAAASQGCCIDFDQIKRPSEAGSLVIEGAGGVLVPLNHKHWIIDLVPKFNASIVLVVHQYLGSLNHTFLTIEFLKQRGHAVLGFVANGPDPLGYNQYISEKSGVPLLFHMPWFENLNHLSIEKTARELKKEASYASLSQV